MAPRLRYSIAILGAVKLFNYLVPLITLPYLTYTLGLDAFGKVAFAQIFLTYFIIITDYGFSWSAIRRISEHRSDPEKISQIFSSVWWAQWALAFIATAIAIALIYAIPVLRQNSTYLLAALPGITTNILMPLWLMQGLERVKEVAIFQIASRIATIPAFFLFIKSPEDGHLVLLITSGISIFSGIIFLLIIKKQGLIRYSPPCLNLVILELKDGVDLFLTKITISLYTTLPPLMLGAISGTAALGLFNLADKIRQVAQSGMEPFSQALFPRMSHLYKNNYSEAQQLLGHSMLIVFSVSSLICIALWLLSEKIILIFGGPEFKDAIPILQWLSPLPILIGLSNIFGIQVMVANNLNKPFKRILIFSSSLSLLSSGILIQKNGAIGTAQTFLICELIVTLLMGIYLAHNGYFKKNHEI